MKRDIHRAKAMERYAAGTWRRHSTRALFFIGGFGTASWAPLVPLLRERLAIGEDVLGMLLLCIGIGSLVTMPLSGAATARFGCRKVLTVAGICFPALLLALSKVSFIPVAVPILLAFGAVMGCIDVAVNIQAVLVEKAAGRRLMSNMHSMWSIGGFAGAGLFGVWVGTLGLTPFASTVAAGLIMLAILAVFSRHLLPYGDEGGGALVAIPKGIVVFVGVVAFISFLAEGAIMDWSGVFLTTVRGYDIALAGTGFTVFSAAMLTMRLLGDRTVQRLGQKLVAAGGSLLSFAGFLLVIFSEGRLPLYMGFFLIGVGSANIVPVFYSLLGRQTAMPIGTAVSAVSSMGYLGVLMGPAAIGFLASRTSLYASFGFLAALMLLQTAVALHVHRSLRNAVD